MVGLGEVADVVQRPTGKAPAPVVVAAGEGKAGQSAEQADPPGRIGAQKIGLRAAGQPVQMVKAHVKGRLGAVGEIGIAKGLRAEAVAPAECRAAVFEQADIHTEIGFIAGAGDNMRRRHRRAGGERAVAGRRVPVASGGDAQGRPGQRRRRGFVLDRVLAVERVGQARVDPNGGEKSGAPIGRRRGETQGLGARRVGVRARPRAALFLRQQRLQALGFGGQEGVQALRSKAGRHQLRDAAHHGPQQAGVVGPGVAGSGARHKRGARKQTSQKRHNTSFHRLPALLPELCRARSYTPAPGPGSRGVQRPGAAR